MVPVIAVPARNEEERLPHLLSALSAQTIAAAMPLRVVIVLNGTTDGSYYAVKNAVREISNLDVDLLDVVYPDENAHVGSARRQAMDRAREWIGADRQGVILTTDADAVPASNWVESNLAAFAAGADLVGGRIIGNSVEEAMLGPGFVSRVEMIGAYAGLCDELTSLIDPISHDPWPRHRDHTGASLAVRSDVYDALGGMPAVSCREDLTFVNLATSRGYRLVHPMDVNVMVSARLDGRAPGGMADCLSNWLREEADGRPILVESPKVVASRATLRRRIRTLEGRTASELGPLLHDLQLPDQALTQGTLTHLDIAFLLHKFAPNEPDPLNDTVVTDAMQEISLIISAMEGTRHAA